MSNIDRLDTFEVACKHFLGDFSKFKDLISTQVQSLDGLEWSFDKGSTKVCSVDEKGLKKRCKVGINIDYRLNYLKLMQNLFGRNLVDFGVPLL